MFMLQINKKGIKSGKLLLQRLNELSNYKWWRKHKNPQIIINWGNSNSNYNPIVWLNHPESIMNSVDKKRTLQLLKENNVNTLEFTFNKEQAKEWVESGKKVIARTLTRASKGRGIKLITNLDEFVDANLYTLYIPKRKEYRVIFVNGKPIVFMRKILKKEFEDEGHSFIRNAERYNFVEIPKDKGQKNKERMAKLCYNTLKALNLDFAAVDILKDLKTMEFRVLEVNTAFGLGEKNSIRVAKELLNLVADRLYKTI